MKYSGKSDQAAVAKEEVKYEFESDNRLIGGNSDNGGLANVNWNQPDNRNDNIGFRPLIALYCLTVFIQPPIIFPISTSWEDSFCTDNLEERLKRHQQGYVPATKSLLPVKLVSYFVFFNKYTAFNFEKYLKSGSGRAFMKKHNIISL